MEKPEIIMPKELKELATDIAALGRKYDLRRLSVTMNSNELWMNNSIISWEEGRHGNAAYNVHIRTEFSHWEEIKEPKKD